MYCAPPATWLKYLHKSKNNVFDLHPDVTKNNTVEELIGTLNTQSSGLLSHHAPVFYLNDYRNNSYVFMSKTIKALSGFEAECFTQGGIGFAASLFHKDDLRLFNEQIFPDRLQFLKTTSPLEHKNYLFSYNFRIKTRAGHFISILQKNSFIQSDQFGNPLMSLGIVYDVTHHVDPDKVIHRIDKMDDCDVFGVGSQLVKITNYYHDYEYRRFSKREREVLLWMADGYTSREIADKLCLSEHTVINHRRKMQEKTNTPNAISLLAYSIKKNLI
ncbi:response regulator transcription factor [Mucilaginibacter rubeus]|uniref:response regulator transcription factor n=1 Tax=Mucilaginibacter rubeus TaxID=2027860 RepID=UPI001667308E|nr:helix-turn-helix transcriptional regulator [Mucilaginibacter rubeus]GGA95975.1 hypothetical protein GCM10011500_09680 [Mucilaginibacter rubeus]